MSDVNKRRCERYLDQMGPSGYAPREGRPVDERERIAQAAYAAFGQSCKWPNADDPDGWHKLVPMLQAGWLAVADAVLPLLADARRQAVEECMKTLCPDCMSGRAARLAYDGMWEHIWETSEYPCRAWQLRALLPPAPRLEEEA